MKNFRPNPLDLVLVGLAVVALALCPAALASPEWLPSAALAGGLLGMAFLLKDAELTKTKALPNGATSASTDGIDLGHNTTGKVLADCELLISAPALVVGDLGDGATMKYKVEHDTDPAFGTVATLLLDVLTQTGAGGVGAAAATRRVRLPTDTKQHIRVTATNSAAGDASDKEFTAELLF
jgi:hypothetical protein